MKSCKTSNTNYKEIVKAKMNPNGRTIYIKSQIFLNWSYNTKKGIISFIAELLSENGYEIIITHFPDSKVGMYRIFVNIQYEDILVFSTNYRDKSKNTIISNTPKDSLEQIIKKITDLHEGN